MNKIIMNLFTLILDYDGGTYIVQNEAESPSRAVIQWAKDLDISLIQGIGPASKKKIITEVEESDNEPTPIQNTINNWCSVFLVRGRIGILTIVKTTKK